MKKVAIMTFHRALNYGAVLQSYALASVLKNQGADVEIIDYRCKYLESVYKPFNTSHCGSLKDKVKKIIKSPGLIKKRHGFNEFANACLPLTLPCKSTIELKDMAKKYDVVITGSDQVFNPDATGGDLSYFLGVAPTSSKKISFSASFGYEKVPVQYKKEIQSNLYSFDFISVRENTGADIVLKLLHKEAPVFPDPTLLLKRDVWSELCVKPKRAPSKYVLVYMMEGAEYVISKAYEIAEQQGLDVVILNPTLKQQIKNRDCKLFISASPYEFLWLFENAQYVVTNSFHGLAFSLIFKKDFYVEASNKEKASRITDQLKNVNCIKRLLPDVDPEFKPDWQNIEDILEQNAVGALEMFFPMIQ